MPKLLKIDGLNKETFFNEYVIKRTPAKLIAEKFGISSDYVRTLRKRYKLPTQESTRIAKKTQLAKSGMKWCGKCKKDKPLSNFSIHNRTKDGLNIYCGSCVSGFTEKYKPKRKVHLRGIKKRMVELKGGACSICGYNDLSCLPVFEFHHIDASTKGTNLNSSMINLRIGDWDKVKDELNKCILVCANCHRKIHYNA